MKQQVKKLLQSILGFDRYLYYFALFKIRTFKMDSNERDFFHFLKLMHSDSHILDVGSNIGITSVLLSRQAPGGQIYSFEPLPPNYETLDKVLKHHKCKNVQVFKFAVGDEEKVVEMVLPEVDEVKMQGLSHVVHEDLKDFNEGSRFQTQLRRLDEITCLQEVKVDGIKLDVENFEYFALRGAAQLLRRDKPVVYAELWENENRTRCFELMSSLGYSIKVLADGRLVSYNAKKHQTQNFFFLFDE